VLLNLKYRAAHLDTFSYLTHGRYYEIYQMIISPLSPYSLKKKKTAR